VGEPLRVAVLETIPEDTKLQTQWNDLVLQLDDPQVFYTYEWSLAVKRAYGTSLNPFLFLAYDEADVLCGLVSLAVDDKQHQVTFLCATTGDYCDFLALTDRKSQFVSAVLESLRDRGIVDITLTNLPADSTTVAAFEEHSAKNGYYWFTRTAYICAQVVLERIERRSSDGKPLLPGRKMVRRSLSAMSGESPVRLDHAYNWDSVATFFPEFVRAHIERFTATGRISNLARPERQRFLTELAKLLGDSGWLALTRMMSGDRVLAWNYGFHFEGTWFWYQPTFDTQMERYSPGFCLLSKLIEQAAEDPALRIVDLGLGDEEYKERFANQNRRTLYVTLRRSLRRHLKEVLRYRATEAIKISPQLERSARKAWSGLRALADKNKT